jgi:hypothetical protein
MLTERIFEGEEWHILATVGQVCYSLQFIAGLSSTKLLLTVHAFLIPENRLEPGLSDAQNVAVVEHRQRKLQTTVDSYQILCSDVTSVLHVSRPRRPLYL